MTDHIVDATKLVRAEFEAWAHKAPANLAKDAAGGYQSATVAFAWRAVQAATQRQRERIAELEAQVQALSLDAKRLDWLEAQGVAYGFQDMHEGNRWVVEGPFATARKAIDAAIAAGKGEG